MRGPAGFEQRLARAPVAVRVGVEEIDAAEAVDLEIDEPGCGDPTPVRARQTESHDPPVGDLDVARQQPALDERSFDPEPHRPSAVRTFPPASRSRSRAVGASTPARSVTIATFASPPAASSASSTSSAGAPVAVRTILRTRARSFSFSAPTSTIRFPNFFPSRIIEIVEMAFRTSFWAVPAFSRVDPAMNSGPTTTT